MINGRLIVVMCLVAHTDSPVISCMLTALVYTSLRLCVCYLLYQELFHGI